MTVLVLADEIDLGADHVVRALSDRDVPAVRIDVGWFPQQLTVDAELRNGCWTGRMVTPQREVALEDIRSVLYRSPTTFRFPAGLSPTEQRHAHHEAKLGVGGVLASLPVLWINHPSRIADAGYKPMQLVTAARCGLTVPATLVTNDAGAARRFATGAGAGGVVTKMLGAPGIFELGGRRVAFTSRLDEADFADLRGVEVTAHQFQQWVPKRHEVRVIVIGGSSIAVAIHARSVAGRIDWRADYAALSYELVDPRPRCAGRRPPPAVAGCRGRLPALVRSRSTRLGAVWPYRHPRASMGLARPARRGAHLAPELRWLRTFRCTARAASASSSPRSSPR